MPRMGTTRISAKTLSSVRDYVVDEPSYTVPFAAWELGISATAVQIANAELLRLGIVHQIEPRKGPYAATYAYRPIPGDAHSPRRRVGNGHRPRKVKPSEPVPGTGKPVGPSGKPTPKKSARRVRRKK